MSTVTVCISCCQWVCISLAFSLQWMTNMVVKSVYLIKFVNEANTLVCQDQCSSLQSPLPCSRATFHIGCQTDSWCSLTSSKHCPRRYLLNILQKLWFGCTRVTTDEYIDISTHLVFLAWISHINIFTQSCLKHPFPRKRWYLYWKQCCSWPAGPMHAPSH